MDRAKHLALADAAVTRAERVAGHAESAAHSDNRQHQAGPLAAAATAWTDVARAHAAIAAALPETDETPED